MSIEHSIDRTCVWLTVEGWTTESCYDSTTATWSRKFWFWDGTNAEYSLTLDKDTTPGTDIDIPEGLDSLSAAEYEDARYYAQAYADLYHKYEGNFDNVSDDEYFYFYDVMS